MQVCLEEASFGKTKKGFWKLLRADLYEGIEAGKERKVPS